MLSLLAAAACGTRARSACEDCSSAPPGVVDVAAAALASLDVEALCAGRCDTLVVDPRIRSQSEFNTAELRSLAVVDSLTDLSALARHWRRQVGVGAFDARQARGLAVAMSIVDASPAEGGRRIILTISRPDGVIEVRGYRVVRTRGGLRAELLRQGES